MDTKETIRYWYNRIGFPDRYDKAFTDALESYKIDPEMTAEAYDIHEQDGKKNFLYYLYFCEALSNAYKDKGISEEILMDTLADMPRWLDTWSDLKGGLYFGELDWFYHHFTMKLFKLGRLQFCFADRYEFPNRGIQKGDAVIDVHIPEAGPLTLESCLESLDMARDFFATYYPEYQYEVFTCHSWLLAENLVDLLGEESNIVKFQRLFRITEQFEDDAILAYTLRWKITRDEVGKITPKSRFAQKVKDMALAGEPFYGGCGYIEKELL